MAEFMTTSWEEILRSSYKTEPPSQEEVFKICDELGESSVRIELNSRGPVRLGHRPKFDHPMSIVYAEEWLRLQAEQRNQEEVKQATNRSKLALVIAGLALLAEVFPKLINQLSQLF